jgi:hypothetical protein
LIRNDTWANRQRYSDTLNVSLQRSSLSEVLMVEGSRITC